MFTCDGLSFASWFNGVLIIGVTLPLLRSQSDSDFVDCGASRSENSGDWSGGGMCWSVGVFSFEILALRNDFGEVGSRDRGRDDGGVAFNFGERGFAFGEPSILGGERFGLSPSRTWSRNSSFGCKWSPSGRLLGWCDLASSSSSRTGFTELEGGESSTFINFGGEPAARLVGSARYARSGSSSGMRCPGSSGTVSILDWKLPLLWLFCTWNALALLPTLRCTISSKIFTGASLAFGDGAVLCSSRISGGFTLSSLLAITVTPFSSSSIIFSFCVFCDITKSSISFWHRFNACLSSFLKFPTAPSSTSCCSLVLFTRLNAVVHCVSISFTLKNKKKIRVYFWNQNNCW